jgi:hypothetical protein
MATEPDDLEHQVVVSTRVIMNAKAELAKGNIDMCYFGSMSASRSP